MATQRKRQRAVRTAAVGLMLALAAFGTIGCGASRGADEQGKPAAASAAPTAGSTALPSAGFSPDRSSAVPSANPSAGSAAAASLVPEAPGPAVLPVAAAEQASIAAATPKQNCH